MSLFGKCMATSGTIDRKTAKIYWQCRKPPQSPCGKHAAKPFTTGEVSHATIISGQASEIRKKKKQKKTDDLGTLIRNQKNKARRNEDISRWNLGWQNVQTLCSAGFHKNRESQCLCHGRANSYFFIICIKESNLRSEHKHISIDTKQKLYGEFEGGIHVLSCQLTAIIFVLWIFMAFLLYSTNFKQTSSWNLEKMAFKELAVFVPTCCAAVPI